jgi:threonine aldolase
MRQAGIIAAAGLYALEHNVERLREDHENAARLARGLRELGQEAQLNTNMVLLKVAAEKAASLGEHLKKNGVLVLARSPMRLVTHLDVDAGGVERALKAFGSFFR